MKSARILLAATLAALSALPSTGASAAAVSRQEIRSMPITQRPSRPGHFYGNTVRRVQGRRTMR